MNRLAAGNVMNTRSIHLSVHVKNIKCHNDPILKLMPETFETIFWCLQICLSETDNALVCLNFTGILNRFTTSVDVLQFEHIFIDFISLSLIAYSVLNTPFPSENTAATIMPYHNDFYNPKYYYYICSYFYCYCCRI